MDAHEDVNNLYAKTAEAVRKWAENQKPATAILCVNRENNKHFVSVEDHVRIRHYMASLKDKIKRYNS